ncbi:MAG: DUF885 domain-containing protein, partial [Prolixibacteraceae bacterium]|nr:DUF885 domain-containing protein [Prolixibacteraceae bacterium]
ADSYVSNMFKFHPEWGTYEGIENADHSGLTDNSVPGLRAEQCAEDLLFSLVKSVKVGELSKNDLVTYNILLEALESSINMRICNKHMWTINPMDAFYIYFMYIGNSQPVNDSLSRENAIARWKKIPQYIENDMENNRCGMEEGYALPKIIVSEAIDQLEQLISGPLDENIFYIPAMRDSSLAFKEELKTVVLNEIMPVVENYKVFLETEYLEKGRPELSISTIPNGKECYEASIRSYTSLREKPEVIFNCGQEAIAIREKSISEIGNEIYGISEIPAIQKAFRADKSNYFNSKEEILEAAQAAITSAKNKLPEYFNLIPKADVIVEPIPEIEEKTGFSRYIPGLEDGSRPSVYIQQTYMPETKTKGDIETTAFHETYPGHHLQIALNRELIKSHPVAKYLGNSGFTEGWARYSESLAAEMGLYTSEKSKLTMLMGLPTGMVVDPGIHYINWTREEAIEYTLQKQTTWSRVEVEQYVDRIAVMPGQMTTYGVGEMYFNFLRKKAEKELGDRFDLKDFHGQCLKNGTIPLNFLKTEVETWIKNQE